MTIDQGAWMTPLLPSAYHENCSGFNQILHPGAPGWLDKLNPTTRRKQTLLAAYRREAWLADAMPAGVIAVSDPRQPDQSRPAAAAACSLPRSTARPRRFP